MSEQNENGNVPFQMIFAEEIEHDQTEACDDDVCCKGPNPTLPLPGIG